MKVAPICAQAGITGFESPAAEYKELGLSLDDLLIHHPNATFLALASGCSMQEIGIFDGDILIVDRAMETQNGDVIVANDSTAIQLSAERPNTLDKRKGHFGRNTTLCFDPSI